MTIQAAPHTPHLWHQTAYRAVPCSCGLPVSHHVEPSEPRPAPVPPPVPTPVLDQLVEQALTGTRVLSPLRDPALGVLTASEAIRVGHAIELVFHRYSRVAISEERRRIADGVRAIFVASGTTNLRDDILALVGRAEQ